MKFLMVLFTAFVLLLKIAGITVIGFVLYYIYMHGIEQLLQSLWKGFA